MASGVVPPKPVKPTPAPSKPATTTTRPSGTIAKAAPAVPSAIKPQKGILAPGKPKTTTEVTPPVITNRGGGTTPPPVTKRNLVGTVDNGDGTITKYYSDGSEETIPGGAGKPGGGKSTEQLYEEWLAQQDLKERTSAFKVLEDTFGQYGLSSLVPAIKNYLIEGLSEDEAIIQLRQTPEYKTRFLGNEGRRAKGLAAYDEGTYLNAEQTYRDILAQAGLDTLANQDTFAKLIGGAVSAAETQDRIQNVFNKIDNADPELRQQIGSYLTGYGISDPNLQRTQLASALLTGGTSAQELVRGIEKAQIKTAALTAGVPVDEQDITGLQKQLESAKTYDVYGTAKKAFGEIAATEPTLTKLANIYGEDAAALRPELQQEAFFGLASQRRKKLQEKEQATFGGQAGTTQVSLGQTGAGTF